MYDPASLKTGIQLCAIATLCYLTAVFCNHGPDGLRQITNLLTQILP